MIYIYIILYIYYNIYIYYNVSRIWLQVQWTHIVVQWSLEIKSGSVQT